MKLKQVGSFLFKPTKSVDYFVAYYNLIQCVWLYRDWRLLTLLKFLNTISALKAVHFLYLSFGWHSGDPLENALHFDAFFLVIGKAQINLLSFVAATMLLCFNQQLYIVGSNYPLLAVLYPVIVQNRWRHFFLKSKVNNRNVCARTRKCFLFVLNLFISLLGTYEVVIVVAYIYYIWIFIVNGHHVLTSLVSALLWITIFHLCALLCCFFLLNFTHSLALNFSSNFALLMMFHLKMQQVIDNLRNRVIKSETFPLVRYIKFGRTFVHSLQFFFAINRFYGKLFCAFLVAFVPINIIITMWIIQDKLDPVSRLFVYFWIGYLCNVLFVLHCIFAQYGKHIHAPVKLLYRLNIRHSGIHIRTRVHIATYVYAFNTQNRYGFTYGVFGLVSLNTFAKFLMLYGKFCLITYKLMKKKVIE